MKWELDRYFPPPPSSPPPRLLSSPPISNRHHTFPLTRRIHWHLLAVLPCLLLAIAVADGQELLVQFRLPDLR